MFQTSIICIDEQNHGGTYHPKLALREKKAMDAVGACSGGV